MHGDGGITATMFLMTGMKIGYARVSTNDQDLTAQRNALLALGVEEKQIFRDHGLTGANRLRPGLREAMDQTRPKLSPAAKSYACGLGP